MPEDAGFRMFYSSLDGKSVSEKYSKILEYEGENKENVDAALRTLSARKMFLTDLSHWQTKSGQQELVTQIGDYLEYIYGKPVEVPAPKVEVPTVENRLTQEDPPASQPITNVTTSPISTTPTNNTPSSVSQTPEEKRQEEEYEQQLKDEALATSQPSATSKSRIISQQIVNLEKERDTKISSIEVEIAEIERQIREIENNSNLSEQGSTVVEDTRKAMNLLRGEDGAVPSNKRAEWDFLYSKLKFLNQSLESQITFLIDKFVGLNNLSERDAKLMKRYLETTNSSFEEVIQELEKRNNVVYQRFTELEFVNNNFQESLKENKAQLNQRLNQESKVTSENLGIELNRSYHA